jgi:hypothetical protein
MPELDIEVTSGRIRPLIIAPTAVDVAIIAGKCELVGWSLRDASGDGPFTAEGTVTSPSALQNIALSAFLPAGKYAINWTVELAGTVAAADANNFQLISTGFPAFVSLNPGVAGVYPQPVAEVTLTAPHQVAIQAIAAGTVGAVYSASMSGDLDQVPIAVCEFRDAANPLAEVAIPANGSASHDIGPFGLAVRGGINLHVISGVIAGTVHVRYRTPGDYR